MVNELEDEAGIDDACRAGSWEKLGRVYVAAGEQPWAQSHAFLPTTMMLDADRIRVYAAFLDRQRIGRIGAVDLDARDPRRVLRVSDRPLLDLGIPGAFDDNGVTPIWLTRHQGRLYLFYTGWQLGTRVRYTLFTGLAVSGDGGESFERVSQTPVLDRSDGELFVRSAVCVLQEDQRWKMWYVGGDRWLEVRGKQLPGYDLRYLESTDLTCWPRRGEVVLAVAGGDEHGFGRPYVVREQGRFRMWYSVRTIANGYRLGYAESPDGRQWIRKDAEVGLDVSASGWDSEMICCSCLQRTRYGTYLFYNGNNYGETGFGVAVRRRAGS